MAIPPASTSSTPSLADEMLEASASVTQRHGFPRSMSEMFPRHRAASARLNALEAESLPNSPSSSSSSRGLPSPALSDDEIVLKTDQLGASTRYAFSDLVCTVLRLDFYKAGDAEAVNFCKRSLDTLLKWGQLPSKTQDSLRLRMEEDQPFNEDIGELITVTKLDPHLLKYGLAPLLGSFLLATLADGVYDARFRVLLRHCSALLGIHWDRFEEFEATLGDRLVDEYRETVCSSKAQLENQKVRERKSRMKRYKRYAMIGAATGLGGVLIGVTGGLAAPLILSSVSALTATAILLPAGASAAIFGSLFGAAGAGLTGYRMQKRVGEIEEFSIERLTEEHNQGLHCVLCVSGWIEDREERAFRHHWRHLWLSKEQYTLRWESKYLEELGKSIDYFVSFVVSYAIQRSLMETMLASLVSAIAWPLVLLGSSCVIDNPWNICTRRASQVGEQLAEVLLTRSHGRRPITLIGFSLGARVIYHCLLEMSKRGPDSLGIVEDVILLGAPVSASPSQWRQLCSVVGGRVINGYCKTDWLLRFLYRTMSVQFIIAGTGPVDNRRERKIVNFNLSHIVKGHLDYAKKLTQVLEAVGVRCTPLSHASRVDLAEAVRESNSAEQETAEKQKRESRRNESSSSSTLDEASMVVEHLKGGLRIDDDADQKRKRTEHQNPHLSSADECDDDDDEAGGIIIKRHTNNNEEDPLGVEVEPKQQNQNPSVDDGTASCSSADTFFSTVSTSNPTVHPK